MDRARGGMHQFGDALSTRSSCEPCMRHRRVSKRRAPVARQARSSRKTWAAWPSGTTRAFGPTTDRRSCMLRRPLPVKPSPPTPVSVAVLAFLLLITESPVRLGARGTPFLHKCVQGRGGLRSGRPPLVFTPLVFIGVRAPGFGFLVPFATPRAARDRAPRDMGNAHFPSPPAWALAIRRHHGTK